MRIKFTEICEIENISREDIKTILIEELENLNADNIIKENDKVSFRNNFWKSGSYLSIMSNIDSGLFKLVQKESSIELSFSYYISFFGSFFIFCIFLFFGFFVEPFLFGGAMIIIINFIRKIITSKNASAELLMSIINQN